MDQSLDVDVRCRIGPIERHRAEALILYGAAVGGLGHAEHKQRLNRLNNARTLAQLVELSTDLAQPPFLDEARSEQAPVSNAEREYVDVLISRAWEESYLPDREYYKLGELTSRAQTVGQLRAAVPPLLAMPGIPGPVSTSSQLWIGPIERQRVEALIAYAQSVGHLTGSDRKHLAGRLKSARMLAQLREISAELPVPPFLTGERSEQSPVGDAERDYVYELLLGTYEQGYFTTREFNNRDRMREQAKTVAELFAAIVDLPVLPGIPGPGARVLEQATPASVATKAAAREKVTEPGAPRKRRPRAGARSRQNLPPAAAPKPAPQPPALRIGDPERRGPTAVLDAALRDARIELSEYDTRLRQVYAAKTEADLAAIIVDLPPVVVRPVPDDQRRKPRVWWRFWR